MRISKKIKPLQFVLVLCIVNVLLCFLLEPAEGASDTMWDEYYQEEELDTIFVGSSVCAASFDPKVFNRRLGIQSFNMGTPSQAIAQSLDAIEAAFSDHKVERVILGIGFFGLQEAPLDEAEMTFERAYTRKKGGIKGIIESIDYLVSENVIDTEKSINFFFPWVYNHVTVSWNSIYGNVMNKMNPSMVTFDADSKERKNWRLEKGYRPYTGEADEEAMWSLNSYYYYSKEFNSDTIAKLKKIMDLCKENGADLLVINTPHPAFDVISCFEYYTDMENQLAQLCKENGVEYYNFSLVNSEIFEAQPEYFYDFEHLNYQGSQAFSEAFCDFMIKRENGENLEQYFYSVEEFYKIHESELEEWKTGYEPK